MTKKTNIFLRKSERLFAGICCALLISIFLLDSRAERLPVKIFTSADGLGSSFVNSLMRDSRGFLWFATRDGLSRFDGSRFVTYQVGTKDAPPGIEQILETSKGVYWIATTSGLYRFDPNRAPAAPQTRTGDRPILNAEYINDRRGRFTEDNDGKLWFVSEDLNLLEENDGKVSLRKIELNLPEDLGADLGITGFCQTRDGSFWISSVQGVIRRLPDERTIFYRVEKTRTDLFASVLEDNAGRIWLTRSSGIYVFKPESLNELSASGNLTVRNLDALAQIRSEKQASLPENTGEIFKLTGIEGLVNNPTEFLYKSADGHVWISAREGIVEFDGQAFRFYSATQGFTGGNGKMVEDSDGNLWLGGDKNLVRLDRNGLTSFDSADGFETPGILTIGENRDGKLYAASSGFVVNQFDGKRFQSARPPLPIDARAMWNSNTVFLDSRGEWWFLTNEKLYRFAAVDDFAALARAKPLGVYDSRDGLHGNQIYRIYEDKQGDVWISTRAAPDADDAQFGLSKFNRAAQTFQIFSRAENYPSRKSASAFAEDAAGNLWIGFYEGGLVRYSGGQFTEITEGLPEGLITDLHLDKRGRFWLSTASSGVARIDDLNGERLHFASYKIENGLSSNNVRSIIEDNFGQIYFGTARGVDRLSPDSGGGHIKHYTTSDGLAGDFVSSAFRDKDGVLWFGTPNGLSRLVPEQNVKSTAPPVWLSGLRIAGENKTVSELGAARIENLELAPDQNNLQIDFFGLDFSPNESLRYQYKLEGADADWSPLSEQRTVNFSNLSAGDYRFLVRAVNADGAASENPAIVSFKLLPPIYARWWFITGAILFVGAGVFALDRFRVKKTRQVKAALDESRRSGKIIRESETRYRTLTETASDAIVTIDERSRIVYVNEAVEKILGYTADELIGEPMTILMPENLRPQHEAGLNRYLKTKRKNISWAAVELPGQHKSGVWIPLELSFGEFEKDGERFFTGIARDISERKKAETALQKSREERFAELERVRSRIARDLHDDVGSSLTQIALYSEVAKKKQNGSEEAAAPLEFLVNTSNKLIEAMSDIVWAINPRKDHLQDLTQRMRHFASESLTVADIDLEFAAPETEADAPLGANIRREVFLIFKESVNNIVKHSGATAAEIVFLIENDDLILRLKDDGRGFDFAANDGAFDWKKAQGNGLVNMKKRAAELGGEYSIDSKIGQGTTITLSVPLYTDNRITHSGSDATSAKA